MITVEKIVNENKKTAEAVHEQNEEILSGNIVKKKKSYLPWIIALIAAGGLAWWLIKKGKKENGTIPGEY